MLTIILPLDVRRRLHERALRGGHFHADGSEDIGGLIHDAVVAHAAANDCEPSVLDFEAVRTGQDRDLADLANALVRARDGLPAIQHPMATAHYAMPLAAMFPVMWVVAASAKLTMPFLNESDHVHDPAKAAVIQQLADICQVHRIDRVTGGRLAFSAVRAAAMSWHDLLPLGEYPEFGSEQLREAVHLAHRRPDLFMPMDFAELIVIASNTDYSKKPDPNAKAVWGRLNRAWDDRATVREMLKAAYARRIVPNGEGE